MERLTARSPAAWPDVLEIAGRSGFFRRALILQRAKCDTIAFHAGGTLLAVAMLYRMRARRVEMALAIAPAAAAHMRALIRQAQLTLAVIAQTGVLVFARIDEANAQGQRMARLTGFRPGRMRDGTIWLWRS